MKTGPARTVALGLSLLAAGLSGCAKWSSMRAGATAQGDRLYSVSTEYTDFYRYGPRQGKGPDRELTKDTIVTMIRPSFGYSKVKLDTGERGFVANDHLRPATADLLATADRFSVASQLRHGTPKPRVVPPEPLPEFEPTPIPVPPNLEH